MAMPADYQVRFTHQNKSYTFDLVQAQNQQAQSFLQITGVKSTLLSNELQSQAVLKALSGQKFLSKQELIGRLSQIPEISAISVTGKTHKIATAHFALTQEGAVKTKINAESSSLQKNLVVGVWVESDNKLLPTQREAVARKFLQVVSERNPKNLKEFLLTTPDGKIRQKIEASFDQAVKNRDVPTFITLLEHLTTDDIRLINDQENLDAIAFPKISKTKHRITPEEIQNLQRFIEDKGFSGVVSLSDGERDYTIRSKKINNSDIAQSANIPFSIHSVSKMFTGVLALELINKGLISDAVLNQVVQFDPATIAKLPEPVQQYITKNNITLRQLLLHESGLGDYFSKYEKALQSQQAQPSINAPEDLLPFGDDVTATSAPQPPGKENYSNLGMLLAGLALRHCYNEANRNKNNGQNLSFEAILQKHVTDPAHMKPLLVKAPPNTCFNKSEPFTQNLFGNPAGGYFTTANELRKFGEWVNRKFTNDEQFKNLVKAHGGEFSFKDTDQELGHPGDLRVASANLTTFLGNGVTIAILSDQGHNAASMLYGDIMRHMLAE